MKNYLLMAAMIVIGAANLNAASPKKVKVTPEQKGVESINLATAEAHINFLASDELEGREAGWKGGHIAGNYLTYKELEPPFICLLVSGGHTAIIKVNDYNHHEIIG